MKQLLDLLSEEFSAAFEKAGYSAEYGRCVVSNRPDLCEFQCNGAMACAKAYKKAPIVIANEVVAQLSDDGTFQKVEAVAPGFINIIISEKTLNSYLNDMAVSEKNGYEPKSIGKTAVIDYGGANVAKPLHVGHLRPAIIGESVKRLLNFDGYKTIGDAHLGDWGTPIGLIFTEMQVRNPELVFFDKDYTGEYPKECPVTIKELEEIYPFASAKSKEDEEYRARARQAVFELQQGRRGYRALWERIMDISKTDLKKNYDSLNVHFELWYGESDADPYIMPMIEDMKKQGIAKISEGALVVDVKEESDNKEMPPCMLLKSDGAVGYDSTDLATIVQRMKDFAPQKIIYVVDKRQGLHFEQVFRAVRKAGIVGDDTELIFLGNGTMNGKDGKPFKTRDGGVLRLEALVKDVRDHVAEKMADRDLSKEEKDEIARKVGLAALKYGDLSNAATKDYIFDIDKFTSFEGNTGPYILYTMVRIKSILEKYSAVTGINSDDVLQKAATGEIKLSGIDGNDSEKKLKLQIALFAEYFSQAVAEIAPHKVCSYLFDLSNCFNSFYHENKIVSEENEDKRNGFIALICLTLKLLETGTDLLAIEAPEKM
ncbi:MAG: arginine--tRNA ligase [Lachnospiraceae bacterium]|nr:arginine--tRNA ligase [Lachnospiraceae bacterium]